MPAAGQPSRPGKREWVDTLSACVNDVVMMRPDNPLEVLAHLLIRPDLRPNWSESASAYVKRHDLNRRLALALDAAGITPHHEPPPEDVLVKLSDALRNPGDSQPNPEFRATDTAAKTTGKKSALDEAIATYRAGHAFQKKKRPRQEMTGLELHGKFAASAERFKFGDVTMFFAGLEGHLGAPSPEVMLTMTLEHDSSEPFDAWNADKMRRTTPKAEWEYVTKGTAGVENLRCLVTGDIRDLSGTSEHEGWTLENFARQAKIKDAGLLLSEVAGVRSYTCADLNCPTVPLPLS